MTILLFEPDYDSSEFDKAHEVCEQLVVARCDTTELLEPIEEALDDIAFLVKIGVVVALEFAVALGRDDDLRSGFGDLPAQMIGVIALVADRSFRIETFNQFVCEGDVVTLPRRSNQTNRIAKRIARSVDFGAQTTA